MSNYLEVDQHRRLRRLFSPAFSDRALKAQETLFQKHADMLVAKLGEHAKTKDSFNMVDMFQFTTFDTMGDLTFGQPLGLLQNGKYSAWVQHVFDAVKVIPIAQIIQYYPIIDFLLQRFEPRFISEMKYNHFRHSADRVDKRLRDGSENPDIWNLVISAQEKDRLTLEEMYVNSEVFMLSGSETTGMSMISFRGVDAVITLITDFDGMTGTSMSGLTYFLLSNPEKLRKLVCEIRGSFSSTHDITFDNTAGLKYLNACEWGITFCD